MESFVDPPLPPEDERALAERVGLFEVTLAGEAAPLSIEVGGDTRRQTPLACRRPGVRELFGPRRDRLPVGERLAQPQLDAVRELAHRASPHREAAAPSSWCAAKASGCATARRSRSRWRATCSSPTSAKARLVEGAAPPAPPARLTVILSDADGNEERLTLFAADAGATAVPARTAGRELTLLLARTEVDELEAKIAAVRSALPEADAAPAPVVSSEALTASRIRPLTAATIPNGRYPRR